MKKTKTSLLTIFILTTFISSTCFAKSIYKFGKVLDEELTMTICDSDSSATAVILCDIGKFNAEEFRFSHHTRIKILKKEGLYLADQVIGSLNPKGVRGKVYNIENGKTVTTKLKSENIFSEEVTNRNDRIRCAFPNVKVGSVIDLEYFIKGLPNTWIFQQDVPVAYSELYLPSSSYIEFRKSYSGYITFAKSTDEHWIAKNIEPFKTEPYLSSKQNFRAKMTIDLLSVNIPGYYKEFTTDWQAVARRLNESEYHGYLLSKSAFLKDLAESIEAKANNEYDKLKLAYDTIKMIKWNGNLGLYSSHNTLRMNFKDKEGSSTDINLMLICLLRRLNLEAYPVVMSTRANGRLPIYFPSLTRLNNTIVQAKANDQFYLCDASDELIPLGMLPKRSINMQGELLQNEMASTIDINVAQSNNQLKHLDLWFDDNLSLSGQCSEVSKQYAAYNYRKWRKDFNSHEDFIAGIESDYEGLKIENLEIQNLNDIYQPIKTKMTVKIENQSFQMGDELFINPMLHFQLKENPFKIEKRLYPVEYPYCRQSGYNFTFNIPEGYTVSELPKNQQIVLPGKTAVFIYQLTEMDKKIVLNSVFKINKTMFFIDEYPLLKEFYDLVVSKQSEPIILKKI